ncbi:MAG TPA: choice-of-anchor tandem repeat GloVer-containing protein [Candidatus Cybelea sp.]|nr:choice-of-anchor tandem repeat GloVer-containing protein [Candidatus Cybelea sp.]
MMSLRLSRYAFACCTAASLITGCNGGSVTPSSLMATAARSRPQVAYSTLYSFKGGDDGAEPTAPLINVGGTLYGTTQEGGNGCSGGCGTVFSIRPSGSEKVLHSFGGSGDGSKPVACLTDAAGVLYGTTQHASNGAGFGTVFRVSTGGSEHALHKFLGYPKDGSAPLAGLTELGGTLYGTTFYGGASRKGTVYSITTSGTEKPIYSFAGSPDGELPAAALVRVNGTLYGTTEHGGYSKDDGTVFSISASGTENVIYRFHGYPKDGAHPVAGLVYFNGMLYGTTRDDGANGYGTVFSITPSGTESVIYSFPGSVYGAWPIAGLTVVNGILYGSATSGGSHEDGTIFSVTTSGKARVLHSFAGGTSDGEHPDGGLVYLGGKLYGTTAGAGANNFGTVFSLTP